MNFEAVKSSTEAGNVVEVPQPRCHKPLRLAFLTEVTDTHVIGYWKPEYSSMEQIPQDNVWALRYYSLNPKGLLPKPFRVKHNGKKFSFGGGSSSGTVNYYFKDAKL